MTKKQLPSSPPAKRAGKRSKPAAESAFPLVGVGASAGGLEAITILLEHLPPHTGMAFVLVQHLAPSKDSILAELLEKKTSMPVREVLDGMRVEPDHVYVIPPNTILTVLHGVLRLQPRLEPHTQHLPVDSFFRSLAEDQGRHAIGVILSGTGSDGSQGVRAIKAEGGIVFAQDEQSARYSGMPKSAAATGAADFVLPPDEIAAELQKISGYPGAMLHPEPQDGALPPSGESDLLRIFQLVRTATGVDFTGYKHSTILRRITRRMLLHRLRSLQDYVGYLQETPPETGLLYQDLLINVTSFFREPETFAALTAAVFPRLLERRASDMPLRVWVPGCSTGEEAYSLALCFAEFCEERGTSHPISFFASDIDEAAIERARHGLYPDTIAQDVSPERLRRFFLRTEHGYRISKAIREQCVFARHNLVKDPPFSRMDLISCRNVLIYFGPVLQKRVLPVLHYALNPDGYLVLGKSESVGEFTALFSLLDKKSRIYARKTAASPPHLRQERGRSPEKPGQKKREAVLPPGGTDLQAETDRVILARYSPAGLVVNEDLDILQFRGNVSPYLKPQPGKASLNLMKMAGEGLALGLRVLIRQAAGRDGPVRKEGITVRRHGGATVNVEVVAFKATDTRERHFLVVFEDGSAPGVPGPARPGKGPAKAPRRSREEEDGPLARELSATQKHLQAVIAEYEASTEELKALNEEVQSSNEELQSINEELETSKEELQSTNEELSTVNDELRSRNEEVTQSNNDLLNVLGGVDIPILLIGEKLQIRRFNASAGKSLNLLASDIGRPIADLRTNLDVADLDRRVAGVIDTLTATQEEVQDRQGRWYSLSVRPYKTADNRIDGALLTLEDINDLKLALLRVQEARDYAEAIVETVREPLIILDEDLVVVTANKGYYEAFGVAPGATEKRRFFDLLEGTWDTPRLRHLLEETTRGSAAFEDIAVDYEPPGKRRRLLLLNARRVAWKRSQLILLAMEDVTERRVAEARVANLNEELRLKLIQLAAVNNDLDAFAASVSHDLRAPLRAIAGFSDLLLRGYADRLDDQGRNHLHWVIDGATRMDRMIDDLLRLSRVSKQEMRHQEVDLSSTAAAVVEELRQAQPDRRVTVAVMDGVAAFADAQLLRIALANLLGNAWKFTAKTDQARIEFGAAEREGRTVYFVKDNGAGFDQGQAARLFLPFQRLHEEQDFAGSGVGLATVERIIRRHGGVIWAEGRKNEGATFFFTLG